MIAVNHNLRRIAIFVTTRGNNADFSFREDENGSFCSYDVAHKIEQERDALKARVAELESVLGEMVRAFENVPEVEQADLDSAPEPRSEWDYNAFALLRNARSLLEGK